jgi:hypothetical protein
MPSSISHPVDAETVEDQTPAYVRELGTYMFSDGKLSTCLAWDKDSIFKSIIQIQEDDYDI